jgi:hypothetical protein
MRRDQDQMVGMRGFGKRTMDAKAGIGQVMGVELWSSTQELLTQAESESKSNPQCAKAVQDYKYTVELRP